MSDVNGDLTPEERAAIARLPRETTPPAGLEDATVRALAEHGLLRPRGAPRTRGGLKWGLPAAAAIMLFTGGYFAGRQNLSLPLAERPRFLLLLYEGPEYRHSPAGRERERVREYSEWAAERGARGELESGEKLREDSETVVGPGGLVIGAPPAAGATRLAGFFLIRAKDDRSALEIARTCPHVRYGGSIVIREIEAT
jgi:hypothetical protein